ncbi:MAG: efflux RND transporter periplasmic adaptor subunit, partial [Spirochaetia bacterium]
MKTGTRHSHRTIAATAILAALLIPLLLAGCGGPPGAGGDSNGPAGTTEPDGGRRVDEDTAFAVNVTRAVRGEIKNYLELNGDVESASSVDVYPDTNGEVANMRARVGQVVSRNEIIAEVDRSRPGQQFEPSPVRAPVAGTITQRYVSVGSTVGPSVAIVQISDTNALEINTRVAERFISLIREGQEAIIFLEAYPEASFPARVTELSPVVDPATRTMGVTLEFVRRDARVKAGMFVEIRL